MVSVPGTRADVGEVKCGINTAHKDVTWCPRLGSCSHSVHWWYSSQDKPDRCSMRPLQLPARLQRQDHQSTDSDQPISSQWSITHKTYRQLVAGPTVWRFCLHFLSPPDEMSCWTSLPLPSCCDLSESAETSGWVGQGRQARQTGRQPNIKQETWTTCSWVSVLVCEEIRSVVIVLSGLLCVWSCRQTCQVNNLCCYLGNRVFQLPQ